MKRDADVLVVGAGVAGAGGARGAEVGGAQRSGCAGGRASAAARQVAAAFVEGFNAADPERVSCRWLRQESEASQEEQGDRIHRVRGGYDRLVAYLARPLLREAGRLRLGAVVTELRWG